MSEEPIPDAEPFKIKMVEKIELPPKERRENAIKEAGFNVFNLSIRDVFIDLLTDSGTTAMSDQQYAAMFGTKQAYAGNTGFDSLKSAVKDIFGFENFVPTHQGRSAEHILFFSLFYDFATKTIKRGYVVPNNNHFDTTKVNIQLLGSKPVDCVIETAYDTEREIPFKGNMDIEKLENLMRSKRKKVPLIMTTVTNNTVGGQPVSMQNIRQTSEIARKYEVPFIIDACRSAENSYFIKEFEPGYENKTIKQILGEMFSYANGCTFSGKKEALTNIGGFLAVDDKELFAKIKNITTIIEGHPSYGGLACRDLSAMATGLYEAIDLRYQQYRYRQVQFLGKLLADAEIPIVKPVGSHAVFIDGKKFFVQIPQHKFPSQTLAVELYLEGGIRSVELGTNCFSEFNSKTGEIKKMPKQDLLRLAIPRRTYTNNHLKYVAEVVKRVYKRRYEVKGLERVYGPALLGHFEARFERVN